MCAHHTRQHVQHLFHFKTRRPPISLYFFLFGFSCSNKCLNTFLGQPEKRWQLFLELEKKITQLFIINQHFKALNIILQWSNEKRLFFSEFFHESKTKKIVSQNAITQKTIQQSNEKPKLRNNVLEKSEMQNKRPTEWPTNEHRMNSTFGIILSNWFSSSWFRFADFTQSVSFYWPCCLFVWRSSVALFGGRFERGLGAPFR